MLKIVTTASSTSSANLGWKDGACCQKRLNSRQRFSPPSNFRLPRLLASVLTDIPTLACSQYMEEAKALGGPLISGSKTKISPSEPWMHTQVCTSPPLATPSLPLFASQQLLTTQRSWWALVTTLLRLSGRQLRNLKYQAKRQKGSYTLEEAATK